MTINEMLGQSGLLTLLGMCVVFSFIIILILCMKLLQFIVHAFKLDVKSSEENSSTVTNSNSDDKSIIAAIATAIKNKGN